MTTAASTLGAVTDALGAAGIDHMVVGSLASSFHGEPRSTMDIDLVVTATSDQLDDLLAALSADRWYVDAAAARDALRRTAMFNVIDRTTGWKVDVILRKRDEFSRLEFTRRERAEILGVRTLVATAEDTILAKLRWAEASGGSQRQLRDVASVLESCGDALDVKYVEEWVARLGLDALWKRVRAG